MQNITIFINEVQLSGLDNPDKGVIISAMREKLQQLFEQAKSPIVSNTSSHRLATINAGTFHVSADMSSAMLGEKIAEKLYASFPLV